MLPTQDDELPQDIEKTFFTPPHWRYIVARDSFNIRYTRPPGDRFVHQYARFLKRFTRAPNTELPRCFMPLRAAHHLAMDSKFRDLKTQIQCCVLAGMPTTDIAAILGLETAILRAFERMFFDVQSRLSCVPYITDVVIGIRFGQELTNLQLVHLHSYFGGPDVCQWILCAHRFCEAGQTSPVSKADIGEIEDRLRPLGMPKSRSLRSVVDSLPEKEQSRQEKENEPRSAPSTDYLSRLLLAG